LTVRVPRPTRSDGRLQPSNGVSSDRGCLLPFGYH
jgi:hypothetical protein